MQPEVLFALANKLCTCLSFNILLPPETVVEAGAFVVLPDYRIVVGTRHRGEGLRSPGKTVFNERCSLFYVESQRLNNRTQNW
jgi:hypothetical protein